MCGRFVCDIPCPAELMEMYPVLDLVNNPRNDSAECIARLD